MKYISCQVLSDGDRTKFKRIRGMVFCPISDSLKRDEDRPQFPVPSHMLVQVPLPDGRRSNPCKPDLKSAHNISFQGRLT